MYSSNNNLCIFQKAAEVPVEFVFLYNASMKRIFRLLLAVWFLCFCVITLKKEAIFTSFFHNVKDIFEGQLFQEEKEVVIYDDLYHPYYAC